jgi:hypothetical protein
MMASCRITGIVDSRQFLHVALTIRLRRRYFAAADSQRTVFYTTFSLLPTCPEAMLRYFASALSPTYFRRHQIFTPILHFAATDCHVFAGTPPRLPPAAGNTLIISFFAASMLFRRFFDIAFFQRDALLPMLPMFHACRFSILFHFHCFMSFHTPPPCCRRRPRPIFRRPTPPFSLCRC